MGHAAARKRHDRVMKGLATIIDQVLGEIEGSKCGKGHI